MFSRTLPNRTSRSRGTIGLLVWLLVVGQSCGSPTRPPTTAVETLSLRDLYPHAVAIAKQWKEDACLVDVELSFWPVGVEGYGRASFFFRSPSTDIVQMFVRYRRATGEFTSDLLSVKEEPLRCLQGKDTDWPVDSIDALNVAQAHGGATFLAHRSWENLHLFLRLGKRLEGNRLLTVWWVAYNDTATGQSTEVLIDATKGQVVQILK